MERFKTPKLATGSLFRSSYKYPYGLGREYQYIEYDAIITNMITEMLSNIVERFEGSDCGCTVVN